jgi:thioredoxin-related protein
MSIKKIRLLILLTGLLLVQTIVFAQAGKLPPFAMMQANGKVFKAEDLPMGKPIIIIYFSPDCDHCNKLMKDFIKRQANFKKASIAMVTYLPVDDVRKFVEKYNVSKYPNIHVGSEGNTFFLKNYYQLTQMPFIALYTKNGDLVRSYTNEDALADLSGKVNNLK